MKKSDLKTGMVVEVKGDNYTVMLDYFEGENILSANYSDNDWLGLNEYREDLTHDIYSKWDIVRVFKPTYKGILNERNGLELIWERNETPEYTIEELIKKVGHEFKIKK